jgi:hypothetical protein
MAGLSMVQTRACKKSVKKCQMKKRIIDNKKLKKLFPTSLIKQSDISGESNGMNKEKERKLK